MVVEAAPTEWILLIKLDTLPYRSGHDDWLRPCHGTNPEVWSFRYDRKFADDEASPLEQGYSLTQKVQQQFLDLPAVRLVRRGQRLRRPSR